MMAMIATIKANQMSFHIFYNDNLWNGNFHFNFASHPFAFETITSFSVHTYRILRLFFYCLQNIFNRIGELTLVSDIFHSFQLVIQNSDFLLFAQLWAYFALVVFSHTRSHAVQVQRK